jgi:hypothetical protein
MASPPKKSRLLKQLEASPSDKVLNKIHKEKDSSTDFSNLRPAPHPDPDMSQRNRQPRDRARNTGHDNGEETALWNDIQDKVNTLAKLEAKSKEISQQIFDMEDMFKAREKSEGISKELAIFAAFTR